MVDARYKYENVSIKQEIMRLNAVSRGVKGFTSFSITFSIKHKMFRRKMSSSAVDGKMQMSLKARAESRRYDAWRILVLDFLR